MMVINFFLLTFFSLSAFAQDPFELSEEELNPSTEEILIKRPEKYLRDESVIYDLNTDRGIKDQRKYTGEDRNRLSFAGHLSGNYEHLQNILGGEVAFMRRSTSYSQFWYGAQFFNHRSRFDAVAEPQEDEATNRPGHAPNTIMAAGLGMGYRFKLMLDFFRTEDVFESVHVFANYVRLNESFIEQVYQGWGMTANYGIHKRSSTNFFYGGKLSYNLAPVRRAALPDDLGRRSREMTLAWLSVAFEIGWFY